MGKRKKRFVCGHFGFGEYCHLCNKNNNIFYRTKDKRPSVIIKEKKENGKKVITGEIIENK